MLLSRRKYLRQTGFVGDKMVHYGKSLISVFQARFASIDKILIWEENWALDYHSMRV